MPRIKQKTPSSEYKLLCAEQRNVGEKNDCVPKALAILTGLPYHRIIKALEEAGRRPKRGTHWNATRLAMSKLGFKIEPLGRDWIRAKIDTYPGVHKQCKNITTHHPRRFPKCWADERPLLLDCGRHVAAFKDGEVHDWSVNSARRVCEVFTIEPIHSQPVAPDEDGTDGSGLPQGDPMREAEYSDPYAMGRYDAERGHTCCPYGVRSKVELWDKGYEQAEAEGRALFPRFGRKSNG